MNFCKIWDKFMSKNPFYKTVPNIKPNQIENFDM